jgi:hypothetical protein
MTTTTTSTTATTTTTTNNNTGGRDSVAFMVTCYEMGGPEIE